LAKLLRLHHFQDWLTILASLSGLFADFAARAGRPRRADNTGKLPGKSEGIDTNLPETGGGSFARVGAGGCRMKQAVPYLGRFLSKFFFEIVPGALVSMAAAYFLSMLHLARGAEPTTDSPPAVTVLQNDGLTADERRELTRQMLKERRENPEEPAEVKPMPSLRPSAPPSQTADLAPITAIPLTPQPAQASHATETKPRAEPEARPRPEPARPAVAAVAPAPTVTPLPRPPALRVRPEPAVAAPPPTAAPATVTAALPAAPAAGTPPPPGPTQLPSVTVNAPPADAAAAPPPQRGLVGNVFSGISTIAGGAANLTGNTVNWVIDLPGKAITASGKLLGVGSAQAPAPASAPAQAGAPAPAPAAAPAAAPPAPAADPLRRNYL